MLEIQALASPKPNVQYSTSTYHQIKKMKVKVAILDLNNNVVNRGVPYIKRLVESFSDLEYTVFDVRHKGEIPDTSFDIYISSGGPGSPFDFEGGWDKPYFSLISDLCAYNDAHREDPKHVFFICHSFQLACQFFEIGKISQRKSRSFGTFTCAKTADGEAEKYFRGLENPFWIADFRDWQVTDADEKDITARGLKILALEKERPHIDLPRAIMAIRFSDTMIGTQFHPEADADGMHAYFQEPERREQIVRDYGLEKYEQMIADLADDNKIERTYKTILPTFLNDAIAQLTEGGVLVA